MPPSRSKLNPDALDTPTEPLPASQAVTDELDPILPLPAGTGIPPVKHGQGAEIMASTQLMMVELPYRAFYSLWDYAERIAVMNYPKYKGGPLDNAAQAALEAVHAFRSSARGEILPILSEEDAQKIRAKTAKKTAKAKKTKDKQLSLPLHEGGTPNDCPSCGPNRTVLKKKRDGKKIWKCADCGHRWPRRSPGSTPQSPSKARSGKSKGSGSPKAQASTQMGKKRPKKRD